MATMRIRVESVLLVALAGAGMGAGAGSKDAPPLGAGGGRGASGGASDFAGDGSAAGADSRADGGAPTDRLPVRPVTGPSDRVAAARPDVVAIGSGSGEVGAMSASDVRVAPTLSPGLVTSVGAPTGTAHPITGAGEGVTIDAVVGQINGRPVFVSEILEPLDGALRAAARDAKDGNKWARSAAESIVRELRRRIEDELILSEARSGLTQEQRAGLLRFLRTIESNLVSAQQGSEVAADEQYREQTGRSLSQEAQDIKDRALITNELRSRVTPRVTVSWRDVQNEYERKHAEFNPPAEYQFRMVYTDATNSSGITSIQEALADGKSFEEIAKLPANDFNRREGGLLRVKCADSQRECEFSRYPELNGALRTLGVGQTLGPIMFIPDAKRSEIMRIGWVYLERIDQPEGVSLYDAQLEIETELRTERTNAEIGRYFDRLRKRGNVSRIEVMADKLMNIATERYAPQFMR